MSFCSFNTLHVLCPYSPFYHFLATHSSPVSRHPAILPSRWQIVSIICSADLDARATLSLLLYGLWCEGSTFPATSSQSKQNFTSSRINYLRRRKDNLFKILARKKSKLRSLKKLFISEATSSSDRPDRPEWPPPRLPIEIHVGAFIHFTLARHLTFREGGWTPKDQGPKDQGLRNKT